MEFLLFSMGLLWVFYGFLRILLFKRANLVVSAGSDMLFGGF